MKPTYILLLSLLMIAGGMTGCNDDKEITLPGGWRKTADFAGEPRCNAVSFVIGTKGYLFGGNNDFDCFYDLWEYNAQTYEWTALADFPGTPRTNMSVFVFGDINKAYVCLGVDGGNCFKDLWEYDITTNVWSRKADFPGEARHGAIGFALNGKGYIVSGGNTETVFSDYFSYDPATDAWSNGEYNPGTRRTDGAAFVYNNKAYILCGNSSSGYYVNNFWRFDPADQTVKWHQLYSVSDATDYSFDDGYTDIARSDPAAFVLGDYGYIAMGRRYGMGEGVPTTWRYDFATDRWSRMHDFDATPRYATAWFTFPARTMIIGGRDQYNIYKEAWEFFPNGVPEL